MGFRSTIISHAASLYPGVAPGNGRLFPYPSLDQLLPSCRAFSRDSIAPPRARRVLRLLHELGLDLSVACDAEGFGSAIFYSVYLGRVECLEVTNLWCLLLSDYFANAVRGANHSSPFRGPKKMVRIKWHKEPFFVAEQKPRSARKTKTQHMAAGRDGGLIVPPPSCFVASPCRPIAAELIVLVAFVYLPL